MIIRLDRNLETAVGFGAVTAIYVDGVELDFTDLEAEVVYPSQLEPAPHERSGYTILTPQWDTDHDIVVKVDGKTYHPDVLELFSGEGEVRYTKTPDKIYADVHVNRGTFTVGIHLHRRHHRGT